MESSTSFNGKALYKPKGRAGEYSQWAVNFYNGCSNGCDYCYLRRGVLSSAMGGAKPVLKKCFRDEDHAFEVFRKELDTNKESIRREGGLLLSFSTDPCLPETFGLTVKAADYAARNGVGVKILTKCTGWACPVSAEYNSLLQTQKETGNIAIGFTLTGCDEKEPHAAASNQRIMTMERLFTEGFRTFASIEPVIIPVRSLAMVLLTMPFCGHYKIGLEGHRKDYDREDLHELASKTLKAAKKNWATVYFKDSIRGFLDDEILKHPSCVGADWDMFKENGK